MSELQQPGGISIEQSTHSAQETASVAVAGTGISAASPDHNLPQTGWAQFSPGFGRWLHPMST